MSDATLLDGQETTNAGDQQQGADGGNTGDGKNNAAANGKPSEGQQPNGQQTDDGKAKSGEGKDDKGGDDAAYVFELKLPDGLEVDQQALDAFDAIAKDKTLSPAERAQKVLDLAAKREQDRIEAHKTRVAEWADQVRNDKDIGGDKLTETLATAKKAVDLGGPELRELLNVSGLGNHPTVVKFMHTVGKALSEDRFERGRPAAGVAGNSDEARAQRLYGKTTPNT